jgi:hypothetical protein
VWLCLLASFRVYGYNPTWELWGLPTQNTRFLDFSLIPGSAESYRRGLEPSVENPGDPGRRLFNYPAAWRLFFHTGMTHAHTVWIAPLLIAAFFVAAWSFPDRPGLMEAVIMLAVLFSPAPMLLYERANVDLIVFVICAGAAMASTRSAGLAAGLVTLGAVLKLFPIAGVSVFWREPRRRCLVVTGACLALFAVYVALTWDSVQLAWTVTQRSGGLAYGTDILVTRWGIEGRMAHLPRAFALVLLSFAVFAGRTGPSLAGASPRNLAAFRMGAAIYVVTFLLGHNFNYRLAFLLLTIPQLAAWIRGATGRGRAAAALLLVVVSCSQILERWILLDELANWALVVLLGYLLARSAPAWLLSWAPSRA